MANVNNFFGLTDNLRLATPNCTYVEFPRRSPALAPLKPLDPTGDHRHDDHGDAMCDRYHRPALLAAA